ncbi:Homeodomain-like-containing protein [Strongyloides ratti]|uniref:Homeodomain-like-containing protein n=1 Tax=Strongyloides ratti TaxID=34506 RepID=A0A090KWD0_STRRB|nr:Homeodomain-like-containing protein [Strongyloides ratti]CEF61805.1 Homeodomain-like-containing protein [Strongyloides ratti]
MMEGIIVNVIIDPLFKIHNSINVSLCGKPIIRTIFISPHVLVKNICTEILPIIGLGHLSTTSEALILIHDNQLSQYVNSLPSTNVNIGVLRNIIGEPITIRIPAKGKPEDFTEDAMNKNLCLNLIKLFLKEAPYVEDLITDPVCKSIIEKIKNSPTILTSPMIPLQSLFLVIQVIKTTLFNNPIINIQRTLSRLYLPQYISNQNNTRNIIHSPITIETTNDNDLENKIRQQQSNQLPFNTSTLFKTSPFKDNILSLNFPLSTNESILNKNMLSLTNSYRPLIPLMTDTPKITQDNNSPESFISSTQTLTLPDEMTVLENWYKMADSLPSFLEFQVFAKHLNSIFNHSEASEITGELIYNWFINRKYNSSQ